MRAWLQNRREQRLSTGSYRYFMRGRAADVPAGAHLAGSSGAGRKVKLKEWDVYLKKFQCVRECAREDRYISRVACSVCDTVRAIVLSVVLTNAWHVCRFGPLRLCAFVGTRTPSMQSLLRERR